MTAKDILGIAIAGALALGLSACNGGGDGTAQGVIPAAQAPATAAPAVPDSLAAAPQAAPAAPQAAPAAPQAQGLPAPITQFLAQHFPGTSVIRIDTDTEYGGLEYDVTLNDGSEVDFDINHQWETVECRAKSVPAALVPAAITSYVKATYQGAPIVKIDRKHRAGYEIEIANGLELDFDANGRLAYIDD